MPGILYRFRNLQERMEKVIKPSEAHPVGSVLFLAVTDNPADLLGYGRWTRLGGSVFNTYAWRRDA